MGGGARMVRGWVGRWSGLGGQRLEGEHEMAEQARGAGRQRRRQGREGQHVGGLVVSAPLPIQRLDQRIVAQHDAELGRTERGSRAGQRRARGLAADRKSTRLNSSHQIISYAVFCLKKKKNPRRAVASCLPA